MELKHIKGIGPSKQAKLAAAGIESVEALARADPEEVATKSGLPLESVKDYKQKAVALTLMEDIKGIGPQTVVTLAQAGITSLKDLYDASAERVAAEARVAREKALEWQAEAKKLAEHVRDEAKTPEGRRKLLKESADASKAAARKTQDTLVSLYGMARDEGEAAIQKAHDLRERAPQQLHDLRQKAEKALKDAENMVKDLQTRARDLQDKAAMQEWRSKAEIAVADANRIVKELKDKTEHFVKTEAEKVKSANKGLFVRIKSKFQRKAA